MKKYLILLLAVIAFGPAYSQVETIENAKPAVDKAVKFSEYVDKNGLKKLVYKLSSDKFEGRESAKDGQHKAANYIRRFYKKIGLQPGNGDSYFQQFEVKVHGITAGMSENVLGFIEGEDKKDEVLVISAHYDHLGKKGKDIYHGADDDGSGTAAIMMIAKAFAKAKKAGYGPRRSILFLNCSGEEKGLLGSEYYTENPVYPLAKTIANLNVDMIGRIDSTHIGDTNYVYLIGSDRLSYDLHFISEKSNAQYTNLELDYTFNAKSDPNHFYERSDHYNFAKHMVPVIFYFSGVHADYHKPTDTAEKILYPKMEKIARLVFFTAWNLANRNERPMLDKLIDKE